ncbi:MAG: hypothetical protein HC898_05310 [Phycisphaerales bacterium]|nr:hypothetical protein [Phycisphaerales bacterium]
MAEQTAWRMEGQGFQLLTPYEASQSQFMLENLLVIQKSSSSEQGRRRRNGISGGTSPRASLMCVEAATGRVLWDQPMPGGPEESVALVRWGASGSRASVMNAPPGQSTLLQDGHIAILAGREEMTGLGLVTGKPLWTLTYKLPGTGSDGQGKPALQDQTRATGGSGFGSRGHRGVPGGTGMNGRSCGG